MISERTDALNCPSNRLATVSPTVALLIGPPVVSPFSITVTISLNTVSASRLCSLSSYTILSRYWPSEARGSSESARPENGPHHHGWQLSDVFECLARVVGERRAKRGFLLTAWVFLPDPATAGHAILYPRFPLTLSLVMESIR